MKICLPRSKVNFEVTRASCSYLYDSVIVPVHLIPDYSTGLFPEWAQTSQDFWFKKLLENKKALTKCEQNTEFCKGCVNSLSNIQVEKEKMLERKKTFCHLYIAKSGDVKIKLLEGFAAMPFDELIVIIREFKEAIKPPVEEFKRYLENKNESF